MNTDVLPVPSSYTSYGLMLVSQKPWSRAAVAGLMVVLVLLLLPVLSYPLGPDNGLFFVSGQKIVTQGAVHYRDIVDVKPPLIYYTNALAISVFGDSPISIRILDLLLQLITCVFLFKLVRRAIGSDLISGLACIMYAVMYIGLNFANTTQAESYVGLFGFPAVYLFLYRRKPSGFLIIGLLCGVLTFYKFTLGITLAGFLLGDLLLYNDPWKQRIRNYSAMVAGFGVVVGLFVLYLVALNAGHGFANMQAFLRGYTNIQWSEKAALVRTTLKKLPEVLADKYSLAMLFGTLIGMGAAISGVVQKAHRRINDDENRAKPDSEAATTLLRVCSILFVLLLGTVALEAKWQYYHIARIFPFGAILGAFGINYITAIVIGKATGRFRLFMLPLIILLCVAFSPISRYVFHLQPAFAMLLHGPQAFDAHYAHVRAVDTWTFEELQGIGKLIRSRYQSGDKLFVSGGIGSLVYLECNYIPDLAIFHSAFLIAPFAPDEWRDTVHTFLLKDKPRFIIIQQSDRMASITSVETMSAEMIQDRMPDVATMLQREYSVIEETPAFMVYEKKSR